MNPQPTGPLPASLWSLRDGHGTSQLVLCLLPDADRERAVLSAWHTFSQRWQHERLTGTALADAAGLMLVELTDEGALEAKV